MANTFLRNDGTFAAIAAADVGASVGYFHVDRNASNQTVTAGAITKVQFNNKVSDPSSWFDAVTNFRFNPQTVGTWLIICKCSSTGVAGDSAIAHIYKNGAVLFRGTYTQAGNTNTPDSIAAGFVTFNGSTDYIEGFIYSPTVTVNGAVSQTYMQGIKLA